MGNDGEPSEGSLGMQLIFYSCNTSVERFSFSESVSYFLRSNRGTHILNPFFFFFFFVKFVLIRPDRLVGLKARHELGCRPAPDAGSAPADSYSSVNIFSHHLSIIFVCLFIHFCSCSPSWMTSIHHPGFSLLEPRIGCKTMISTSSPIPKTREFYHC